MIIKYNQSMRAMSVSVRTVLDIIYMYMFL